MEKKKFEKIVGPVAKKIKEGNLCKCYDSVHSLACLLLKWSENYPKRFGEETFEKGGEEK